MTIPGDFISDFSNEQHLLQVGKIRFDYNDVFIPGDGGMDIQFKRYMYGAKWSSGNPYITTTHTFASSKPKTTFSCLDTISKMSVIKGLRRLQPIGYDNLTQLPSHAEISFDDYSIFYCADANTPMLALADGRKIKFTEKTVTSTTYSSYAHYSISEISDKYGNTLTYIYEEDPNPYTHRRLKQIVRNDGVQVNFIYKVTDVIYASYTPEFLSEIEFMGKKVKYLYSFGRLDTFIDPEGLRTEYGYDDGDVATGFGKKIKTVVLPNGAKIEYGYVASFPDTVTPSRTLIFDGEAHYSEGYIYHKKISGPGIQTRNIYFNKVNNGGAKDGYPYTTRYLSHEYNYEGDLDLTIEYYFSISVEPGLLLTVSQYVGEFPSAGNPAWQYTDHDLIYEREYDYINNNVGTAGCEYAASSQDEPTLLKCQHYIVSKKTESIKVVGGMDLFVSNYTSHNIYGGLEDYNYKGVNNKNKYNQQRYLHNIQDWILNSPTTLKLSDSNSEFVTVEENTYYASGIYTGLGMLYESKLFGQWKQRVASYHENGNVKKIEFNENLKTASGSVSSKYRYSEFISYQSGTPKQIRTSARYSDSRVLTLNQDVDYFGMVTSRTDLNGYTTKFGFDKLDRPTYIDLPDGTNSWSDEYIQWSENLDGTLLKSKFSCQLNTSKSGCVLGTAKSLMQTSFDSLERPILASYTDLTTDTTKSHNSAYNIYGQPKFISYWSSSEGELAGKSYEYDEIGRVNKISQSGGGDVLNEYLLGNRIRVTDAEDNVTTSTYLAYESPSYQQTTKITSPESVTTDIAINIYGNIDSIKQSGLNGAINISQTEYRAYDSYQRLCQVARNDIGTTVINRKINGEINWQAQGQTAVSNTLCNTIAATADKVSFTYDNLGGQQTIKYGDSKPTSTFNLDNNGNVKTIVGQGFSQNYNYNSLNLLEDETLSITGRIGNLTLVYGYDKLGNLSSLKYPDGLAKIDFTPNAFGQPTQAIRTYADETTDVFVKGGTNKATYYPNGMINSFIYGNEVVHKTTLNDRLIPRKITDKFDATDRLNLSYTYDNNSNITSLINSREAGVYSITDLTYDGLDRLTNTTGAVGIGSSAITYDGLGNIRTYSNDSVFNTSDLTYKYKTNFQVNYVTNTGTTSKVRDFSTTASYDARGNVLKNGNNNRSFKYNLANQMTESGTNRYVYDGYNRRVKTEDSKGTSYSFYSQGGKLLYRETPQGGINYVFLGSKLIAKEGTGVVAVEDSIMNYKPFGESIEEPKDDVGFTGHKFDTDLGLSYMQARYYDPVIGRFYSNDPVDVMEHLIGEAGVQGFNRYAYANNNPYKYTDPDGKSGVLISPKFTPRVSPVAQGVRQAINTSQPKTNPVQQQTQKIAQQMRDTVKNSKPEVKQHSLKETMKGASDTTGGFFTNLVKQLIKHADDFAGGNGSVNTTSPDASSSAEMSDDTKRVIGQAQILMAPPVPPQELTKLEAI
jgi:RHS repeat-associated protein